MLKQSNILTAQCDTFQENKPLNILYLLHINIREKKLGQKKADFIIPTFSTHVGSNTRLIVTVNTRQRGSYK